MYYSNIIESNKNNTKKQWKTIKELVGDKVKETGVTLMKTHSDITTSCPKEVSNILNNYFCSIALDLRQTIAAENAGSNFNDNNDFHQNTFNTVAVKDSIFFYPTNKTEIRNVVSSLKNNKAPGFDNITPVIIKEVAESIIDVIVHLTNLSLSSGEFPTSLKHAVVTPLFKKNDRLSPGNYRPIALLPVFSKLVEKIVKVRLVNFLSKQNFFCKKQYGFQSKLNTSAALLDFMSQVYTGVNEGKVCAGLFVDVMKAFDTVDHRILLSRMHDAGIRGVALKWFCSYLSDRT